MEIKIPDERLRELQEDDLDILLKLSLDDQVFKYYFRGKKHNRVDFWQERLEETERFRLADKNFIKPDYHLVVEHQDSIKGFFSLYVLRSPFAGFRNPVEMSYFLGNRFRGQGLMTSCLTTIVPYTFDHLNSSISVAFVSPGNTASIRALKRQGLTKKEPFEPINSRENHVMYGLLYEEFKRQRTHSRELKYVSTSER